MKKMYIRQKSIVKYGNDIDDPIKNQDWDKVVEKIPYFIYNKKDNLIAAFKTREAARDFLRSIRMKKHNIKFPVIMYWIIYKNGTPFAAFRTRKLAREYLKQRKYNPLLFSD